MVIDLEISFSLLEFIVSVTHKIYKIQLYFLWKKEISSSHDLSIRFLKKSLKLLPNGSFISFNFDYGDYKFVQFANINNDIIMDIPLFPTNYFYNKKIMLKNMLLKAGLKKRSIKEKKLGGDKLVLLVSFGQDYDKVIEVVNLICKKIYKINSPCIVNNITDKILLA